MVPLVGRVELEVVGYELMVHE
jgi:hypothetical protein